MSSLQVLVLTASAVMAFRLPASSRMSRSSSLKMAVYSGAPMERITGKSAFDMDVLNRYLVRERLFVLIFCFSPP